MPSLLSLLLPYILLVVIIGLCLALFLLLKTDVRRYASQWTRERDELLETHQVLKAQISALEQAMRTRDERVEAAVASSSPVRPSLNLQRRAQILRLAKRGDRRRPDLGGPRHAPKGSGTVPQAPVGPARLLLVGGNGSHSSAPNIAAATSPNTRYHGHGPK